MDLLCVSSPFAAIFILFCSVLFHCYTPSSWFYLHYCSVFLYSVHICPFVTYYSLSCTYAHMWKLYYFQSCYLTSDIGFLLAIQKLLRSWNALQPYYWKQVCLLGRECEWCQRRWNWKRVGCRIWGSLRFRMRADYSYSVGITVVLGTGGARL